MVATGFEKKPDVSTGDSEADVFKKNLLSREERFASFQDEKKEEKKEEQRKDSFTSSQGQNSDPASITVNRWQDLQQQLGKRSGGGNDYSIPAVLRYSREDDER